MSAYVKTGASLIVQVVPRYRRESGKRERTADGIMMKAAEIP